MSWEIRQGDALELLLELESETVQAVVTSPPYWGLRDYGHEGQLGLEPTPEQYVENMVAVFREVRRVLRDDGTVWLNLGDSYAANRTYQVTDNKHRAVGNEGGMAVPLGLKAKDLIGIPWRVAFALQADGWWLRSDIVWSKPNPMPESVTDRPTRSHEYVFLLSKRARYYFDAEAIREPDLGTDHPRHVLHRPEPSGGVLPAHNGIRRADARNGSGRNKRSVWEITTQPFPDAHFATFPTKLVEPCILAGSRRGDLVLDPFAGTGTTGLVALRHNRSFLGLELNPDYCQMARHRIIEDAPLLNHGLEVVRMTPEGRLDAD